MRRVDGAIRRRRAADERRRARRHVREEARGEAFGRERPGPAADLDLDARELPALLRVVRRLAEHLGHLHRILLNRLGVELEAGDDFRRRAHRREVVEQLRPGRTHREAAGKGGRELLHAEQRDVPTHRLAGEVGPLRRAAVVGLREEIAERHRVHEPLPRHVAVAAVARRRPRKSLLDQMLAEPVVADAKRRAARPGIGHEAVREQHELAIPVVGDLDAVETAVVFPEERLGAWQRVERGVARTAIPAAGTAPASRPACRAPPSIRGQRHDDCATMAAGARKRS